MRKSFIYQSDKRRCFRRFNEKSLISHLVAESSIEVRFSEGVYSCSLEFLDGSLLISDKSFSRLRAEIYRLYSVYFCCSSSILSLTFYIYD